ncbi:MAG TPA: PIG-L family deacetylase [Armatimonadota bacterium]
MNIQRLRHLTKKKVAPARHPRRGFLHKVSRPFRVASIIIIVVLVAVLALVGICALATYHANYATYTAGLPAWSIGPKDDRVLIFAPHCDDETLACGGLINRLVARKSKVLVVFATNGDAFRIACVKQFHQVDVGPSDFVKFGYFREKETMRALRKLGLSDKDVIFLGYPDRGLAKMWSKDWDTRNLYTSAYTGGDHSPYRTSFRRNAPYCGSALLGDLKTILQNFKPTSVYYPHSYEQHSDHWGAYCFMTQALYETGMIEKVKTGLYLVHRGDWPVPQGVHEDLSLPPPAKLNDLGTQWYEFNLTPGGVDLKLNAIRTYKSQTAIMNRFLTSFARTNELFGEYPPVKLRKVPSIGSAADIRWSAVQPDILDPVGDNINVDVGRNGDIQDIRVCTDDRYLYVRLHLAHEYSYATYYALHMHTMPAGDSEPINIQVHGSKCDASGVRVSTSTKSGALAIPLERLGNWDALMLNADSRYRGITLDKSAWRVFLRDGAPSTNLIDKVSALVSKPK